ncbi:unnamed protein product [marine sediment metagenome]|uniref:High potential iron-sulfur proteins family profile domain-containing protein n=1 Tax=marine sediment metagenome TaxID=412755 RepID=X0WAL5_9ZZZZ
MADDYPQAGRPPAQPEIQRAVRRFRSLPIEQRERRPLLYWLLGSGTPPYKTAPEDADYVDPSETPDQACSNCAHAWQNLGTGITICALIRDPIAPGAWCRFWEPTTARSSE